MHLFDLERVPHQVGCLHSFMKDRKEKSHNAKLWSCVSEKWGCLPSTGFWSSPKLLSKDAATLGHFLQHTNQPTKLRAELSHTMGNMNASLFLWTAEVHRSKRNRGTKKQNHVIILQICYFIYILLLHQENFSSL